MKSTLCKTMKWLMEGLWVLHCECNTCPPRKIQNMRQQWQQSCGRQRGNALDPAPRGSGARRQPLGRLPAEETREVTSFCGGQGSHLRGGAFVLSLEEEVLDKKWKKGIQAVITV